LPKANQDKPDFEHIREVSSWNSGGGVLLDLVTLRDGQLLVVSDYAVVLYQNMNDLEEGKPGERQTINL
jgi:hypothetical protein